MFLFAAPEEVASLAFEDKETMSVRVVWTEPGNINGILMGMYGYIHLISYF